MINNQRQGWFTIGRASPYCRKWVTIVGMDQKCVKNSVAVFYAFCAFYTLLYFAWFVVGNQDTCSLHLWRGWIWYIHCNDRFTRINNMEWCYNRWIADWCEYVLEWNHIGIDIIVDFLFAFLYFHIIYSIQISPSVDENQIHYRNSFIVLIARTSKLEFTQLSILR